MAFKSIAEMPTHVKEKPPVLPFISVNRAVGGYLGGGLFKLLGEPAHLKVEYDEETQVLRIAIGADTDVEMRGQGFSLPETVRHALGTCDNIYYKNTVRYRVEQEDEWWYITDVLSTHRRAM